jgi:hypothetical protein
VTTVYHNSVLDHPADKAWSLVRDFNNYPRYIEGVTESVIEDGRPGDEVGAVRRFCYGGAWIRQRLVAHSDTDRCFTYAGMEPFEFPDDGSGLVPAPIDYSGTLRLTPVVGEDRTFAEWSVSFESVPEEAQGWTKLLSDLVPQWMRSLERTLNGQPAPTPITQGEPGRKSPTEHS